jgi:hypothetical protein
MRGCRAWFLLSRRIVLQADCCLALRLLQAIADVRQRLGTAGHDAREPHRTSNEPIGREFLLRADEVIE